MGDPPIGLEGQGFKGLRFQDLGCKGLGFGAKSLRFSAPEY